MSFKSVVVLGGGPIGLLCAIEARQKFVRDVFIIEKRNAYTRTNVPSVAQPIQAHLKEIGVAKTLWSDKGLPVGSSVSFSRIEEELWMKARNSGVKMFRGYTLEGLMGRDLKKNGRYKSIGLTLREWDDAQKQSGRGAQSLSADLLIVASGGGASSDPVILQKLGFEYEKLEAHNYGAYGIFEVGDKDQFDRNLQRQVKPTTDKIASGVIAFNTPDHNYLLVTLSQITATDFQRLKRDTEAFEKILLGIGRSDSHQMLESIKEVQKNMGLFEISIQRAKQFYSPTYPAVLVGDAAVTPHPEAGSGIGTGFKGFQELQKLLAALKGTHRSKDNRGAFMAFNDRCELHISKKALEGTRIVLRNLKKLLTTFAAEIHPHTNSGFPALNKILLDMEQAANTLRQHFDEYDQRAKEFMDILEGDTAIPVDWVWDDRVGDLWADIDRTFASVNDLTRDISLLDDRLEDLESKINFKKG